MTDIHPPQDRITQYDPNISPAKVTYRLTFMQWEYQATHTATARGHVRGLDLDGAFMELSECLGSEMLLTAPDGETLLIELDEDNAEETLADMLVAAEIISVERYQFGDK